MRKTTLAGWMSTVLRGAASMVLGLLLILGFWLVGYAGAQATPTQPAGAGTQPVVNAQPARANSLDDPNFAPEGVELIHDVVIGTGGGQVLHAEIARPKVLPKDPMPVLLQIHGGGWSGGSHKTTMTYKVFAQHGYFGASIEYRLASKDARWPAQIEDCKLAVRWIRANAEKYHINPNAIGVLGGSAGGHLVACLGVLDDPALEGSGGYPGVSSKVQAVVDVNGPTNLVPKDKSRVLPLFAGSAEAMPDAYRQSSPILHIHPNAPPFFIIHGDKDEMVPVEQSTSFAEALKNAGVPVEILIVKGASHGLDILVPGIEDKILDFCDKHLKGVAAK
ncbi:MAG: alpha/beta hydrolase [Candidatus Brocadiia bacterium]|jgi:acetyl esterase/lipase